MPAIIDLLFTDIIANYSKLSPTSMQLTFPSSESIHLIVSHVDHIYHYVTLQASHVTVNAIIPSFTPTSLVLHVQARPYAGHVKSSSLLQIAFMVRAKGSPRKLEHARFALVALLQTAHDVARSQILPFACNAHFRTYSGVCNNVAQPKWGASRSALKRIKFKKDNPAFKPDTNDLSITDLPNARLISRLLCQQRKSIPSQRKVSALAVYWGQFIDHDIGITPESQGTVFKQNMDIKIRDKNDPFFKRHGGQIHFTRSRGVNDARKCCGHGMAERMPRGAMNEQSSYIDGSHVYGCDRQRVNALRAWRDGSLRTGRKTPNGEHFLPGNNEAEVGVKLDSKGNAEDFVSGDVRVNEQPMLSSLHTMFMREHNRIATKLRGKFSCWKDEKIFQYSRRIVSAQIQLITYQNFLPGILGNQRSLKKYSGYKKGVDASITAFFSTAAFRFGHSMVPEETKILVSKNKKHAKSGTKLHETFFNPGFLKSIGVEPLILGASHQVAEKVDTKVINSLQNELFKKMTKGIDLVSLNLQRGRDHGIPLYNDAREMYGLRRKRTFKEVTGDKEVSSILKKLYGSVDRIESYIGGLSERHVQDSELGELFHTALVEQFTRLRDGDRFFYRRLKWPAEMEPMEEIAELRKETLKLSTIFVRNGGGSLKPQDFGRDVFRVE